MSPARLERFGRSLRGGAPATPSPLDPDIVRPMPRRQPLAVAGTTAATLPVPRRVAFRPGTVLPFLRLLVWLRACIRFFGGNAIDRLRGRSSTERSAARLREVFDGGGVSFAKLAQQLSLRADLLPYVYCTELSKLLDRAKAIPTEQAIGIIEHSLGKPLEEMFSAFDPDPIGSASLACVYQATLKSGEKVAVKVRRPGIGPLLSADLRALDWLLILAEMLTLVRPGLTTRFRQELRTILMGELSFRAEARHTEMFRLRSEKDGAGITAPRVYFAYCSDEVLVTELVSGLWMRELMAAVDRDDEAVLSSARGAGIDPQLVARRLMQSAHRVVLEHPFFHADPHPANIVILPDSRICFIDFGAVGRFSSETRNTWRELQYHMKNCDIERMVECSVRLAGPLPPMDINAANESMKEIFADWVRAVSSPDAQWWERSTAQNWLRYVGTASEYGIPVSLETLQFFRSTLLYDSIIMRLHKDIDPVREYTAYAHGAARNAQRRVNKEARKRLKGMTSADGLRAEQLASSVSQFALKFQRRVEDPLPQFRHFTGKAAYALSLVLRLIYLAIIFIGFGFVADAVAQTWFGRHIPWSDVMASLARADWFRVIALVVTLVVVRRLFIRAGQPDRNIRRVGEPNRDVGQPYRELS